MNTPTEYQLRLEFRSILSKNVTKELLHQICANEVVLLKGMEQVWKVILTAPDKHIAFEATHFLIKMYLEVSFIFRYVWGLLLIGMDIVTFCYTE